MHIYTPTHPHTHTSTNTCTHLRGEVARGLVKPLTGGVLVRLDVYADLEFKLPRRQAVQEQLLFQHLIGSCTR
jgi:hypothetical protein